MRYGQLAAIYDALIDVASDVVDEKLNEIDASLEELHTLRRRCVILREDFGDQEISANEVNLVSWLVAACGPLLRMVPTEFEELVASRSSAEDGPICPRWALSMPAAVAYYRRLPAAPLFDVSRSVPSLARAYAGLLEHIEYVYFLDDPARRFEILNSAFTWRIVALADHLQPEDQTADNMAYRLGRLRFRVVQGASTSTIEQDAWRSLDELIVCRRNVLTHLGERTDSRGQSWDFSRCIDEPLSDEEVLKVSAAISTAVLEHFVVTLRDTATPDLFRRAAAAIDWVTV